MQRGTLAHLGVSEEDERCYRALLRLSEATADELSAELGTAPQQTAAALEHLSSRDLAEPTADGRTRPAPPAKAVQRLIEQQVQELRQELERVVVEEDVVESLLNERATARPAPELCAPERPAIERIEGLDRIRAHIDELTFFTRSEGLTTQPHGTLTAESIAASRPLDTRILRRGVRMRTIMGAAAAGDPPTLAYLSELVTAGAEIRISDRPLERLLVFDRAAALTPIDPGNSVQGALLVREPGLVANLVSLFERMWNDATDIRDLLGFTADPGAQLTDVERKILATMYQVDKDESGAREVGLSVRTYRKYIADLMHRLGAANRFQAALLARDRGWI
ncbi:helix-turn-helix domain-containing protein [Streptomyces flavidovirens]|uniref:Helix-turn-helix domain-containing protein n=1 Tax=Streptomyces flavidovirens TaxID=67298 RepID=A0ABW6REX4_9ACTN